MVNDLFSLSPYMQGLLDRHCQGVLPLSRSSFRPAVEAEPLVHAVATDHFPLARDPESALSGLLLLLQHWESSHRLSQEIDSPNGSYWHAIAHRIEPDSFNASYWFRRVARHAIYPELQEQAAAILAKLPSVQWRLKTGWDPSLFIDWCDQVRTQPGSPAESAALAIQKIECELLFAWCCRPSPERTK